MTGMTSWFVGHQVWAESVRIVILDMMVVWGRLNGKEWFRKKSKYT